MTAPRSGSEPTEEWDGGWDQQRVAQALSWSGTTPQRRLRWLEDALRLAARTGALQRSRRADDVEKEERPETKPEA